MTRCRGGVLVVVFASALVACHVPGADDRTLRADDPASVVGALLSPGLDPDDTTVLEALIEADALRGARTELIDALRALEPVGPARMLRVEPLDGLDRTAVDAEIPLAGAGVARIALDLCRGEQPETGWRVAWFAGAGVEWPPPDRRRGTGLTTSAGPGDGQGL